MKLLNIALSIILIGFVLGSAYFIRNDVRGKRSNKRPDFIATKFVETNLRTGPEKEYPIILTYTKINTPLKVLDYYKEWYQVLDAYGNKGWVYKNLVKTENYAIVTSNAMGYKYAKSTTKELIIIKRLNIVEVLKCEEMFCKISTTIPGKNREINAWVHKHNLWGAIN